MSTATKFAAVAAGLLSNVVATSPPVPDEACFSGTKSAMFIQTRSVTSMDQVSATSEFDDDEGPSFVEELERQMEQQRRNSQNRSQQQACPQGCTWCNPVGSSSEVVVQSDLEYGAAINLASGHEEPLLMDTYNLRGGLSKKPVVLVIHGGAFRKTSTKKSHLAVKAAKLFAQHGYWVASIEYRRLFEYCLSHQQECWRANRAQPPLYAHPVHDTLAAVRYIHKYAADLGVDAQKIALFGCSAGGITIADALTRDYGEGQSGNGGFPSSIAAGITLSGGMSGASAASHKAAGTSIPPYLAFHNAQDLIVPYKLASNTKAFLDGRGSTNNLITIPGSGHCPNVLSGEYLQDILGFLQNHLKLPGDSCSSGAPGEPVDDPRLPVQTPVTPAPQQSIPATPASPVATAAPLSTTVAPTTSAEGSSAAFDPVGGSTNRACRGSHQHGQGHTGHRYEVLADSSSLEDCQARCASSASCTGVEFFEWGQYKRCKAWTTPITGSWRLWGSRCFRKTR